MLRIAPHAMKDVEQGYAGALLQDETRSSRGMKGVVQGNIRWVREDGSVLGSQKASVQGGA